MFVSMKRKYIFLCHGFFGNTITFLLGYKLYLLINDDIIVEKCKIMLQKEVMFFYGKPKNNHRGKNADQA